MKNKKVVTILLEKGTRRAFKIRGDLPLDAICFLDDGRLEWYLTDLKKSEKKKVEELWEYLKEPIRRLRLSELSINLGFLKIVFKR